MISELDYDKLREMIARCEWTFAKTMPFAPHEYIVKERCPLSAEEFEYFVNMQREHGIRERWGKYNNPYLYVDDYKYWTMGAPLEETTVINRAKACVVNDVHQLNKGIKNVEKNHIDEYIHQKLSLKNDDKCFNLPDPKSTETVAQYAARVGLIAGDIYTFVAFAMKKDIAYQSNLYDDALASQNYCSFGWVRLIVKENLSSINTAVTNYSQLFDVQNSGGDFDINATNLASWSIDWLITIGSLIMNHSDAYTAKGAIGLIRSRLDQDLRSDSTMNVIKGNNAENMYGIASEYILDEWKNATTSVGDSDLILEGGDV